MKKSLFLRTVCITAVVIFCFTLGFYSAAKAYENIRLVAFGEYRKAIQIEEDGIYIFDFLVKK